MKTVKLKINGMSCSHCVMSVKKALEQFNEVKNIKVDVGSAQFKIPENFDLHSIVMAIEDLGFETVIN